LSEFELAAFFAAHGSRTYAQDRTKTRTYRNAFLIAKDESVVARMASRLEKLGIKHTRWYAATDGLHYIRIETKAGEALAAEYRLDDKATERRIPNFIYRGGDAEVRKYIETYVNLRAECPNRYKLPRLNIPFRSPEMAADFQRLLSRFAVPCTLTKSRVGATMLILTHEHIRLYEKQFTYTGDGATRLRTKLNRLDERGAARAVYSATDPIRSIVVEGKRPCRCLTVDEDHTFIANGLVVHNSTYASRKFVAWRLGRRPRDKMIGGGHSQRFVENEFSKKIRDLIVSPEYQAIFPNIVIDKSTSAKDQWAINGGGQYIAKGAGQAVHGFRANFICVDDPYPKVEAAESATIRETVKTWFFTDLGTRLLPGATIFLIMTRFHEDDLTGSVMEANKNLAEKMRYKIVEAPAICFDPDTDVLNRRVGQVLWDYYDLDYFADKRATQSYQRFSLVYQQNTGAADTDSIASKLKYYKTAPHADDAALRAAREKGQIDEGGRPVVNKRDHYRRIVLSVDTATKPTQRADYTVIQCWAETGDRKHILLDQKRGKWALPEMTKEVNRLAKRHGVDAILVEDKGNGTAYIQEQGKSAHQARKAPAPIIAIQVPSNQGKEFRFDEITPMIEAGEVFVPENADWIDLFVREMAQFPDGAHDDQVDALTQYLRWVKTKRTRFGSKKVGSMG